MRKMALVAWREFWHLLRSRAFIITTVGVPLLMVVLWGLTGALDNGQQKDSLIESLAKAEQPNLPVGYVDPAAFIRSLPPGIPSGLFVAFPDESAAATALDESRIGAYFVLSTSFLQSGEIKRVSPHLPLLMAADRRFFEWVLDWNLVPDRSAEEVMRLRSPFGPSGIKFVPTSTEDLTAGSRKDPGFAPFLLAMVVTMPLFIAGGYLLQGLAQEKENRIIEVLLVSLEPWQLLGGKLIGLAALTVVQFGAWLLVGGLTLLITGRDPGGYLQSVDISGVDSIVIAAYAVGAFLVYATLMAALGAIAPNIESTRMWATVIGLPTWLPILFWPSIVNSPDSPLAVALSIVPFCAPVAMIMRLGASTVPAWEVGLSLVLLFTTSVVMLSLMSRLFRATTLLSGQPLSPRLFLKALKAA